MRSSTHLLEQLPQNRQALLRDSILEGSHEGGTSSLLCGALLRIAGARAGLQIVHTLVRHIPRKHTCAHMPAQLCAPCAQLCAPCARLCAQLCAPVHASRHLCTSTDPASGLSATALRPQARHSTTITMSTQPAKKSTLCSPSGN